MIIFRLHSGIRLLFILWQKIQNINPHIKRVLGHIPSQYSFYFTYIMCYLIYPPLPLIILSVIKIRNNFHYCKYNYLYIFHIKNPPFNLRIFQRNPILIPIHKLLYLIKGKSAFYKFVYTLTFHIQAYCPNSFCFKIFLTFCIPKITPHILKYMSACGIILNAGKVSLQKSVLYRRKTRLTK